MIAVRPITGELVCHFQYTPNDVYDVDGTDEPVLADLQIGGRMRKVMIQANKNGFLYVLDRTNCTPIAASPYTHNGRQYVTIASGLGGLARRFAGNKVPTGGSVWTFALMPD